MPLFGFGNFNRFNPRQSTGFNARPSRFSKRFGGESFRPRRRFQRSFNRPSFSRFNSPQRPTQGPLGARPGSSGFTRPTFQQPPRRPTVDPTGPRPGGSSFFRPQTRPSSGLLRSPSRSNPFITNRR